MASAALPNGAGGDTNATRPPHPPAYEGPGPCGSTPTVLRGSVTTSNTGDRLSTTLTLPGRAAPGRGPPWPVVAFFNGFQARASFYRPYATHLASWGFAVLQYDAGILSMPPDALELAWLGDVVAWARSTPAAASLDTAALFTAGHSRGGKLAALHAAGAAGPAMAAYAEALAAAEAAEGGEVGGAPARHAVGRRVGGGGAAGGEPRLCTPPAPPPPPVSGAFLIDAIDNTRFAPESPAYPSAARALAGQTPVGLAAAGVFGACNPVESGFRSLWPAAGPGSWLAVLPGAGHAEFLDAGPILNRVFDALCKRGDRDAAAGHGRAATMARTGAAMAAWLDGHARGHKPAPPPAEAGAADGRPLVSVALSCGSDGGLRVALLAPSPAAAAAAPPPPPPPPPPAAPVSGVRRLVADFLAWARAEAAARPGAWQFGVKPGGRGGGGGGVPGGPAGNVVPFQRAAGPGGVVGSGDGPAAAAAEA